MSVEPALGQEQCVLRVIARWHGARRLGPISVLVSVLISAPVSGVAGRDIGRGWRPWGDALVVAQPCRPIRREQHVPRGLLRTTRRCAPRVARWRGGRGGHGGGVRLAQPVEQFRLASCGREAAAAQLSLQLRHAQRRVVRSRLHVHHARRRPRRRRRLSRRLRPRCRHPRRGRGSGRGGGRGACRGAACRVEECAARLVRVRVSSQWEGFGSVGQGED